MSTPKHDYTRDELIAICERAIVPDHRWSNRDSAHSQEGVGRAWALLRAECDFDVQPPRPGESGCFTDERTIWLRITWPGFQAFEFGRDDLTTWDDDLFYLPTPGRLDEAAGSDWYG